MPVPIIYRKSAENIINSWSYIDIAQGTGIIEFYGGGIAVSGSMLWRLDNNVFNCTTSGANISHLYRAVTPATTSFVKKMDENFDTAEFNRQVVMKGTALANIPYGSWTTDANGNVQTYVIVTYSKVDTSNNATQIATTTCADIIGQGGNPTDIYFGAVTTIPITTFKIGEKLRVNLKVYSKQTGTPGPLEADIFFDPSDRAVDAGNVAKTAGYTRMSFFLPFKIDL